jgi:4-amino-4-deoxy-L-arabinose transferase-like glycosyltransferase
MDTVTFSPGHDDRCEPAADPRSASRALIQPTGRRPGRFARLWRGPGDDPTWARPALLGLLAATAVFYLVGLTSNGWANAYYSAAVQAGSTSWESFFFGSSDAGNSITIDKPPASLWVMVLSVRLLGLSSFAILLPQVVMGVATVGVVATTVKRRAGAAAGLVAGAVMALTPVAVLMFRFNNPDALLVLLMTLAAAATIRAVERASGRWLVLAGVLIGLGFLTKALQVLLVVPFLGIAYLVAAPTSLRKRLLHSLVAIGAMVVTAGWWVAIVELVPANLRPYIGGSQTNSFLELTFGYNGFGRLSGDEAGSVGGGNGWGQTGIWRMLGSDIGGQISWLIPSALILLVMGLWFRRGMPRTDTRRAAYLAWGGWLVVTGLTFSFMAGIFHQYYTVALAPPVAALVGLGAVEAWEHRDSRAGTLTLSAATAAAAVWSFVLLGRTTAYPEVLRFSVLAVGLAAALLLLGTVVLHRRAVPVVLGAALAVALAGPAAYSLTTVSEAHTGSIVTAGPSTGAFGGPGGGAGRPGGGPPLQGPFQGQAPGAQTQAPTGQPGGAGGLGGLLDASAPSTEVVTALSADAEEYTWVAAAVGSQNAAGLQLATDLPVMSIGGFNGSDPSPTLAEFQQYVADGRIHYFAAGGGGAPGGGFGNSGTAQQITQWVESNFGQVTIDGSTFYDLSQPLSGE